MMQCFDGGKYDKRFVDVYKPAIEAASLKPVRADSVLETRPIIETIEAEIQKADAILADISESNDNVFLELGYALALGKPCVMICDKERRTTLPFDVRHRPVIFYDTNSPSSFSKLSDSITSILKAEMQKENKIQRANVPSRTNGETIEDYENIVIGIILANHHQYPEGISAYMVSKDFEKFGYTDSSLSVAIGGLVEKGFISKEQLFDQQAEEHYTGYALTNTGMQYVLSHKDIFVSKKPVKKNADSEPPF